MCLPPRSLVRINDLEIVVRLVRWVELPLPTERYLASGCNASYKAKNGWVENRVGKRKEKFEKERKRGQAKTVCARLWAAQVRSPEVQGRSLRRNFTRSPYSVRGGGPVVARCAFLPFFLFSSPVPIHQSTLETLDVRSLATTHPSPFLSLAPSLSPSSFLPLLLLLLLLHPLPLPSFFAR